MVQQQLEKFKARMHTLLSTAAHIKGRDSSTAAPTLVTEQQLIQQSIATERQLFAYRDELPLDYGGQHQFMDTHGLTFIVLFMAVWKWMIIRRKKRDLP